MSSHADVRALIRAANPIGDDATVSTLSPSELSERVARIVESSAMDPIDVEPSSHPAGRRWMVPAAAAGVVLVIALTSVVFHTRATDRSTSQPSATAGTTIDKQAQAYADRLVGQIPLPVAAQRRSTTPTALLASPVDSLSDASATSTAWWVAPGNVNTIFDDGNVRLPSHWTILGFYGYGAPPTMTSSSFLATVRDPAETFAGVVTVRAVPYQSGLALRADVQVLVPRKRTGDQTIPVPVDAASVVLTRLGKPDFHGVLTVAAANRLAELVNGLSVETETGYVASCPMSFLGITITFTRNGSARLYRELIGGCGGASIGLPDDPKPLGLIPNVQLRTELLADLGLPANWFSG